jgi:predicted ribosome quality control (RQC) complex YloA/Tae2 family protein
MAFDAGMLACVISEIKTAALGARIEKISQPEKDEIVLQMRSFEGGRRLLIHAGSNNPRIGFTTLQKENPLTAPMLCMLLRKHLSGGKLSDIRQEGFERVVRLEFETRDEMGFACRRYLVAEIMGKYSNMMFTDEAGKILAVLRPVDFSTSSMRQVLPGMTYELPPAQDKVNPLSVTEQDFYAAYDAAPAGRPAHKWLLSTYQGISAAVAREMVYLVTGDTETPLEVCGKERLWRGFDAVIDRIRRCDFAPTLYLEGERAVEYCFMPLSQYGDSFVSVTGTAGEILDRYFATRDREVRVKQRAADILHILTNAETRLHKKLDLQRGELADCEKGSEYKRMGDLITSNLYLLERGMTEVTLTDYEDYHEEDGSYGSCTVTLDARLSPTANAQIYYKKYNKTKTAREELTRQIALGESELTYVYSVFDALTHAETDADLSEIRDELYRSGYASRMKQYRAHKQTTPRVAQFVTTDGLRVLCGKNNVQNEYITHKMADRNDYWFHAKGVPGSHVVLVCNGDEEPSDRDFTEAAEIAAYFSKAVGGDNIGVDYTRVRNVKKPAGGKPGLVIYHTNWTAYVTPDGERIAKMRVDKK